MSAYAAVAALEFLPIAVDLHTGWFWKAESRSRKERWLAATP